MSGVTDPVTALMLAGGILGGGAWAAAVIDDVIGAAVARTRPNLGRLFARPWRQAALLVVQSRTTTERPDWQAWGLAPALLVGLAAAMIAPVPLAAGLAIADIPHGVILVGAAAALVVIPTFLEGWSPNSPFSLIGGYRMFATALSYMIPLALVLIAAALPAESLALGRIVEDQQGPWNVVRMPLGLPIFLVAATGLTFWGPGALPTGADLAGGIDLEPSSVHLLAWRFGRRALQVGVAAVTAAVFLGGWQGPWLPGGVWMGLKTAAVLVVLVASRHVFARIRPEAFVKWSWIVLLPLALVDVFATGGWLLL
jgi:NADH-quinone oxidoreductase subunit H